MNEQIDIVNLLKDKSALLKYILGMIGSSDKFAKNCRNSASADGLSRGCLTR